MRLATAINVRAGGAALYKELYAGMSIFLDSRNLTLFCFRSDESWRGLLDWQLGNYSVHAYFSEVNGDGDPVGERYWRSQPVTFRVVSHSDFATRSADFVRARQTKYRPGYDLSLVHWASQLQRQRPEETLKKLEKDEVESLPTVTSGGGHSMEQDEEELVLLIGVKTAVISNFVLRQAIRETWASKDFLPRGVKVLFMGCRPLTLEDEDPAFEKSDREAEHQRLREAIDLEKMIYGDLLTDELDCDDSYLDLANKVKEFLHVAATQYSSAQFVMLADDDVYIRADKLLQRFTRLGPQTRHYSGQVPSKQYGRKDKPNRDATARYSLSVEQYPLSETPPMAMGAYFFLSMDCVKFISKNRCRLRSLNGIDDITIPLWMLAIQVHVQHQSKLGYLRAESCNNKFVAFGDFSPLALREVHSNLQENRSFCHGFERYLWLKASGVAGKTGVFRVLPWFHELLKFGFDFSNANDAGLLQITAIISTPTHAGVKVSYFPSNETFSAYTRRVWAETRLSFPSAVNSTSSAGFEDQFESELRIFVSK